MSSTGLSFTIKRWGRGGEKEGKKDQSPLAVLFVGKGGGKTHQVHLLIPIFSEEEREEVG